MWRDRERSDIFATISMRAAGLFGMEARSGPAVSQPKRAPVTPASFPGTDQDGFTWADKQEFMMHWKPAAEAAGVSEQDAKQRFLQEVVIPRRSPLNDEPFH